MKNNLLRSLVLIAGVILPCALRAQSSGIQNLHNVLENLYNEMIPLCSKLTDVARAVGAFGALWYIGYRVYKHIANAEAIDFFPLFKPFVLAILIGIYPKVLATFNGILKPMVTTTSAMVQNSNAAVDKLLAARAKSITEGQEWQALMGGLGYDDQNKDWYKYQNPDGGTSNQGGLSFGQSLAFGFSLITNTLGFIIKGMLSIFLQVLYYAAALCIDTMRTFHLLILGILGPFVLCLSMYDGFQHTLPVWLGRYINIYLWLPIANLFGALIGRIQQGMLKLDISQSQAGDLIGFGASDMAYLIFLVIAIIGYFTIPSIANYVIHASGAHAIIHHTNKLVTGGTSTVINTMTSSIQPNSGAMTSDIQGSDYRSSSMADAANSEPYFRDSGGSTYQKNQISGS